MLCSRRKKLLIVHFVESIQIITKLIQEEKLSCLLEGAEPEEIALLVNNFSLAEIAFEAEVLSLTISVFLYLSVASTDVFTKNKKDINLIAKEFEDNFKVVFIDVVDFSLITKKLELK